LVARSNKRCGKIYRRMQFVLEDEEQNRKVGREVETE